VRCADALNAKAISLTNSTGLSILPSTALVNLKALVCASIYKRCVAGVVLGRPSTYLNVTTLTGTTVGLPYHRPCLSLCTPVAASRLTRLLGATFNCSAVEAVPGGLVAAYGPASSSIPCNNMTLAAASALGVGVSQEALAGSTCAGLGSTVTYIPPAQLFNASWAPLTPPGVLQAAMEERVLRALRRMPVFVEVSPSPCVVVLPPPDEPTHVKVEKWHQTF
jgi:hypothetical protein